MPCTFADPSTELFENGMYIGIGLQDILYGIELLLYFGTMRIFLSRRRQPHKADMFYAIFSTVMLILITIWVVAPATLGQKMWLLHRSYPGGPVAYHKAYSSDPYMNVARISLAILQQMVDALMIYRCRIVWGNCRVVIVPLILWLANLALCIWLNTISSLPGTTFYSGIAAKLVMAYLSSSVFLNVVLSSVICYRMLRHARAVKKYLGDRHASPYLNIVTLVVESVLPFTLSGIAFMISHGIGSRSAVAFSFVHSLVLCVSQQMLIFRAAAKAEAWQQESITPESMITTVLDHTDMSNQGRFDGSGAILQLEMLPDTHEEPSGEDVHV